MIALAENVGSAKPLRLVRRPSATLRLAQMWGCSEKTVECRLSGEHSIFSLVADALMVAVEYGQTERVGRWLDVIEAPLWGRELLPYAAARLQAGCTDAAEDLAEMEYEANSCKATAEALIRKSAADRLKAEERERSLKAQWGIA